MVQVCVLQYFSAFRLWKMNLKGCTNKTVMVRSPLLEAHLWTVTR